MPFQEFDLGQPVTGGSLSSASFSIGDVRFLIKSDADVYVEQTTDGRLRIYEKIGSNGTVTIEINVSTSQGFGYLAVDRLYLLNQSFIGGGSAIGSGVKVTGPGINNEKLVLTNAPSARVELDETQVGRPLTITETTDALLDIYLDNLVINVDPGVFASNDTFSGTEDTKLTGDVSSNDDDVNDAGLSYTKLSDPTNGTLTLNTDGTFAYAPFENFNGTDSFTYQVQAANGDIDTATVTLQVSAANDPPAATPDTFDTVEDMVYAGNVLVDNGNGADSDPEGDALTVTLGSDVSRGSLILNSDGSFTYTPDEDFYGTDSFTYRVSDGVLSDMATVTLNVTAVNDAPVAVDDTVATDEEQAVTIRVLGNDTDVDEDDLSVTAAQAVNGMVSIVNGIELFYTPNTDFSGVDTISYTISDGNGGTDTATVTVTVNPLNDAPVAVNDTANTDEDTPVRIDVLANDNDVDGDALSVTEANAQHGTVVINAVDGSLTYTPRANYNGLDTITYTISDGRGGTDTAMVTVDVASVDDAPVAVDDTFETFEDNPLGGNVLDDNGGGADSDGDEDHLTVSLGSGVSNGTLVLNSDGTFDYTPNGDFNGVDSFTYEVSDGVLTDTGTVTIDVMAENDAPEAVDDIAATDEDSAVIIDVLGNDSDIDSTILTVVEAQASNGSVDIGTDGRLTYTSEFDFNGVDVIDYTISDGDGGTDTATVTVTVNPVNDDPTAVDDSANTDEDTAVTFDVLVNDTDVDGDILFVAAASAQNGSMVINSNDGRLTYTPDKDFNGIDTITYTASDGNGGTDTAMVTVNVAGKDDAPVASDDSGTGFGTDEDTAFTTASVLANDTDADGDALSVSDLDTTGTKGLVTDNGDGTFDYDPNGAFDSLGLGETGTDSFQYTVSDGNGGTSTATVTISVDGREDASAPDPVTGTAASDNLIGTDGADAIRSLAGRYDKMFGGEGADQFIFGSETNNGSRERDVIMDYEVGIDSIVLEEGANVASIRATSSQVVVFLTGDRDAIYVRGEGVTADNLTIVDAFEFI